LMLAMTGMDDTGTGGRGHTLAGFR
jgi:hypothetical protein